MKVTDLQFTPDGGLIITCQEMVFGTQDTNPHSRDPSTVEVVELPNGPARRYVLATAFSKAETVAGKPLFSRLAWVPLDDTETRYKPVTAIIL